MAYAFMIFWSAVGGIVYVMYSADTRAALKEEMAAAKEEERQEDSSDATR